MAGVSPPQLSPGYNKRKPGIQTGFAIRSPDTLPAVDTAGKRPNAGAGSLHSEY